MRQFACKECRKRFRNQAAYEDHINSDKHRQVAEARQQHKKEHYEEVHPLQQINER